MTEVLKSIKAALEEHAVVITQDAKFTEGECDLFIKCPDHESEIQIPGNCITWLIKKLEEHRNLEGLYIHCHGVDR